MQCLHVGAVCIYYLQGFSALEKLALWFSAGSLKRSAIKFLLGFTDAYWMGVIFYVAAAAVYIHVRLNIAFVSSTASKDSIGE